MGNAAMIDVIEKVHDLAAEMEHPLYQARQTAIAIGNFCTEEQEPIQVLAGMIADILEAMEEKQSQIWRMTHPNNEHWEKEEEDLTHAEQSA